MLLENVEEELNWDPEVTADHIAVNVNQGAVTLGRTLTERACWCSSAT
jgi:osmotically-inducible protein OsmY